jgi:hypothetical protein
MAEFTVDPASREELDFLGQAYLALGAIVGRGRPTNPEQLEEWQRTGLILLKLMGRVKAQQDELVAKVLASHAIKNAIGE